MMATKKKIVVEDSEESAQESSEDETMQSDSEQEDITDEKDIDAQESDQEDITDEKDVDAEESDQEDNTDEKDTNDEESDQDLIEDNNMDKDDSDVEHSNESDLDDDNKNDGWADAMAKILKTNKPKNKKTLVLSRAKKINEVKKEKAKPAGYQVETQEGIVKDEEVEAAEEDQEVNKGVSRKKKKDIISIRKKPNILEKDRERLLMKIATKGVVQLFNAVKMQQKDIKQKLKEAGPLDVKRDKVLKNIDKNSFLDVLMGGKSKEMPTNNKLPKKDTSDSTWNVLRDDFMMGAKMKDWDKELEEDEEEEMEVERNIESE